MDKNNYGKFLLKKILEIKNINDESIVNIYTYLDKRNLLDEALENDLIEFIKSCPAFKGDGFIDYLCSLYVQTNNEESVTVRFINDQESSYLCNFFRENVHFAKELMQNFFGCVKRGDFLLPEPPKEEKVDFTTMPDLLRFAFNDVVDYLYNNGLELDKICMLFKLLFSPLANAYFKGGKLAGVFMSDKRVQDEIYTLLNYGPYFRRMILADTFAESVKNNTDNSFDRIIEYIEGCSASDKYVIPDDPELIDDIFTIFMHANDDLEELHETINSLSEEDKNTYMHIHPFYPLENIGKGRN